MGPNQTRAHGEHADQRMYGTFGTLQVATLATEVGLSRAAFAARFTSLVGQPPLSYLTEWRMTLAADLLGDTEATVATVARHVGYEDPFAFSVAFKRTRGTSTKV